VYLLPHYGKRDRAFTRCQPKDAVGFVRCAASMACASCGRRIETSAASLGSEW
jgi:hypothetical protein